jgi:hypothetical protein
MAGYVIGAIIAANGALCGYEEVGFGLPNSAEKIATLEKERQIF